jgi:hypothetical protein
MEWAASLLEGDWYPYAVAYAYALIAGLLVGPVTAYMYDLTGAERENTFKWQPPILGIVERTLFLSSLITEHGSLIALWLTLKLGFQYKRWSGEDKSLRVEHGDEVLIGRTLFMNSMIGSALSILYAAVGFGMVKWLKTGQIRFTVIISSSLVVGTIALLFWLWCHRKAKLQILIRRWR